MSKKEVLLMNQSRPVCVVTIDETGRVFRIRNSSSFHGLPPLQIVDADTKELSVDKMNIWLSKRRIPDNREGIDHVLCHFPNILEDEYYLSITDPYWFLPYNEEKEREWDKLNFFTNPYSEAVGNTFFSPWTVQPKDLELSCPDRTTNGVLRKRWTQEQGTSYLLKAASKLYRQEPLSEVLASIALEDIGMIPFVKYELCIDGMRLCSKCENFVTLGVEFVPASVFFHAWPKSKNQTKYEHLLECFQKFQIFGARDFIDRMIVADSLILNPDRHLGNFGVMRDATTGRFLGFAPLFDFGSSYLSRKGNPNQRIFTPEEEKKALERMVRKGLLTHAPSMHRLLGALTSYPDIDDEKKENIQKKIQRKEREVEKLVATIDPGFTSPEYDFEEERDNMEQQMEQQQPF